MNAYAAVRNAYTESSVMTASREQLVVMLYDGAIRFLRQSADALRNGRGEYARDRMRRAEAIIDELNLTLDMSYGEVPHRLRSIYLFCKRHLIRANLDRDPQAVERVAELLAGLREAWAAIADGQAAPTER